MKKISTAVSVLSAAAFVAIAIWGQFITGDEMAFSIVGLYILAPLVALVCCLIITLGYRFYGFIAVGASFVATMALHFSVFGTADILMCIIFGAAVPAIGVGIGLLLSKGGNLVRTAYRVLLITVNTLVAAGGTMLEYLGLVLLILISIGDEDWKGIVLLIGFVIVHAIVSLIANAILRRCFKKSLGLTKRHIFVPMLVSLAVSVVALGGVLLVNSIM